MTPILDVRNLKQHFVINRNLTIPAVDDVTFSVERGEVFGIVGETGSGKSTIARSVLGIYPITSGEIYFKGNEISGKNVSKDIRKDAACNMQIIFQDSAAALHPSMRVEKIIAEPMEIQKVYQNKDEMEARISEVLKQVGLSELHRKKYPSELSGGMRQRVAIARSIAINPDLIIADEPIASLDVSIQAQIVTLFQHLQKEHNFSFIFIAHDLSMVKFLSDRILVMLKGKAVELGRTEELFANPIHPYTKALLSSAPVPDPDYEKSRVRDEYDTSKFTGRGVFTEVSPGHYVLVEE
jgi:oligopeptide transport system ATP-binding protein